MGINKEDLLACSVNPVVAELLGELDKIDQEIEHLNRRRASIIKFTLIVKASRTAVKIASKAGASFKVIAGRKTRSASSGSARLQLV